MKRGTEQGGSPFAPLHVFSRNVDQGSRKKEEEVKEKFEPGERQDEREHQQQEVTGRQQREGRQRKQPSEKEGIGLG